MGLPLRRHRENRVYRRAFPAVRVWFGSGLFCLFLAGQAVVLASSPPPPSSMPGGGRSHHPAAAGAASNPAPESAVVYDDTYHPPAKDLQLSLDGDRKAEAAARFMHGLMLEDAASVTTTEEATNEYLKSLALDPGNVELSVSVAQDYLRKGDVPAAINLLKDTIKAAPKRAEPELALAYVYFTVQNKPDLALKSAAQALELAPDNILGYVYLQVLYKATDQSAKIAPLLERASKVDSKDPDYWLQLGKLYIQTFVSDDPSKNGDDLKKTSTVFQKAAVAGADNAEALNKVANFYLLTKQYNEAAPLFERVVEMDQSQNSARENLARCYLAVEQPAKAALVLEELIKVNPADPHAYEILAKIYEDAGDYTKATEDYEQALLVNPGDIQGYGNVVRMLLNHKQSEKAIAVLTEARKRFPDQPWFLYRLAEALEQAKQHQQSLLAFEQTEVEAQGTQPSLLDGQFYFEFGATAEQAGLYDRAAQLMKKSLGMEEDPRLIAITANYLGYMWVDHSTNVEEGGDLIKRALEADPENGAYLDSMGWYYYRTNQFEQATTLLTKAVQKTEPEDPTVYEHLGDAYWKQNDAVKAVSSWQRAIDLDPSGTNVPDLNKKIAAAKPPLATPAPSPKG